MQPKPIIKKQPAESVRYGPDISTTGKWVYCAYDGDRLVAVAATVKEAKRRYSRAWSANLTAIHKQGTPQQ
jgi:hypothetical protein